nr:hypothetical protein [Tanacetum cinerariifolium]
MMIKGGKIHKSNKKSLKAKDKGKANGKGKDKQVYIPKHKNLKNSAKEHPTKDDTWHHYKEVGHCKRNCHAYLAELIKNKKQVGTASSSDVFIIELLFFPTKSWVYDTSCGTHICNTKHGLGGEGILKSTDDESFDQCVSCLLGKMTRKSFPHRPERATDLLGIIHTDVCGLLRHMSRHGASYFITFIVDHSRYGYVYLLKHKHESTTRILNMVPTKKVDKSLYELWYGKFPNLSYLKVLGCKALVKQDTPDKLQQRSVKCIFIGYPKETMGYYFYFPPENKIVVARYAEFFEKNLITQEVSGRAIDLEEIQDEDTSPSEITSEIPVEVEGFEPPQDLQIVKDYLGKCFAMKDLGEAAFILRIKIYRDRSKQLIELGQNAYIDKILKRYKMDNSKRGYIPMQERLDLNKTQGTSTPEEVKRMQNVPYASAVGSIINLKVELRVDCYCNAGFKTDIDDMKSQTKYVFNLNGRRNGGGDGDGGGDGYGGHGDGGHLNAVMKVVKQIDQNKKVVELDNELESDNEDVLPEVEDLDVVIEEVTS